MDWKSQHEANHRTYKALRSPRSECPICWEMYKSSKKEKPTGIKPRGKKKVEPKKHVIVEKQRGRKADVVDDVPVVIGNLNDSKPKRKRNKEERPRAAFQLNPDQYIRTRNNVELMGVTEKALDDILNRFKYEINDYISRFRKVYLGLSERMVSELIISVIDGLLRDELIIQNKE